MKLDEFLERGGGIVLNIFLVIFIFFIDSFFYKMRYFSLILAILSSLVIFLFSYFSFKKSIYRKLSIFFMGLSLIIFFLYGLIFIVFYIM